MRRKATQPHDATPAPLNPEHMRADIRAGTLWDFELDALYPSVVRDASARFWTPLSVARRAAQLLVDLGVSRTLDVGAGAGKFCIVAGAVAEDVEFVGVEQRPHLVEVARALSAQLGVTNAQFVLGDATKVRTADFDALYFFNPFAENMHADTDCFDATVELSEDRLVTDVRRIERALAAARKGVVVVTYHGFGGLIPGTFDLLHAECIGTNWLRVWRKERPGRERGECYLELDDRVVRANVVKSDDRAPASGSRPRRSH